MPISNVDLLKAGKTSLDHYLKNTPIDQIGVEVPLYKKLMSKAKKFGGAKQNIVVQLRKSYDSNFRWSYGENPVNFNRRDTVEQAYFAWKRCEDGFRIPHDELFSNGIDVKEGKSKEFSLSDSERVQLTSLMDEQMESFRVGYVEKLSMDLHRDGTQAADAVVGLDALVSTTPTSGVVGGINRATNPWWRNNAQLNLGGSGGPALADIAQTMEAQWRACIRNGGTPDFILAGSDFIDAYRKYAVTVTNNAEAGKIKTIEASTGSGASTGLYFKGIEIIWDPQFDDLDAIGGTTESSWKYTADSNTPSGWASVQYGANASATPAASPKWTKRCYMLNTKFLELYDNGIDIITPTRPHDTLSYFQMATQRLALVMKRANCHSVIALA